MGRILLEPIRWIVGGGVTLLQAVFILLTSFGHGFKPDQQAAITGVFVIVLAEISRTLATPNVQLPAGVPQQIADAKAVKAAEAKG